MHYGHSDSAIFSEEPQQTLGAVLWQSQVRDPPTLRQLPREPPGRQLHDRSNIRHSLGHRQKVSLDEQSQKFLRDDDVSLHAPPHSWVHFLRRRPVQAGVLIPEAFVFQHVHRGTFRRNSRCNGDKLWLWASEHCRSCSQQWLLLICFRFLWLTLW
jgi:hypothetical protein